VEGHASISPDILARYAADAALEVDGVRGLVEGRLPSHRGVRVSGEEGKLALELHLEVEWGASIPAVGAAVQRRVRDYLTQMADLDLAAVNVVVDELGPPAA
jgi:uncharacterized alkaline shock family protein YloU